MSFKSRRFERGTWGNIPAVRDNETNLIWRRKHAGPMSWNAAMGYAIHEPEGWRLPTVQELLGLVDHDCIAPAIDTEAFPDTPPTSFWSATSYVGSSSLAWYVYFYSGSSDYVESTYSNYVRLVRDAPEKGQK